MLNATLVLCKELKSREYTKIGDEAHWISDILEHLITLPMWEKSIASNHSVAYSHMHLSSLSSFCGPAGAALSWLWDGESAAGGSAPQVLILGSRPLLMACSSHGNGSSIEGKTHDVDYFRSLLISLLVISHWPKQVAWPSPREGKKIEYL